MGFAENSPPQMRGRQEMRDLVRATFDALDEAELTEIVCDLRDRVFERHPDDLLETTMDGGVCHWRFKPMVELMLRHVLEIAANEKIPAHDRQAEIEATVELAGF